jgi:predicted DNA repair protein MutK
MAGPPQRPKKNMAASSLLALIDDIAAILDDVALLTKAATKKTAGVLGDDLALNAQQVAGVRAERELPVVWAVAKGSAINKAIIVPAALAISAFAPWAVVPLLMLGGAFLCYEGVEKLAHRFMHSRHEDTAHREELVHAVDDPAVDLVAFEKEKIRGAIRTDLILSAEIVVIALGTVAQAPFTTRVAVLVGIAALMTVGVYGLVAGIVKLDDLGAWLGRRTQPVLRATGRALLRLAPWLMKALSVAGTAAMFLVGGGIVVHGIGVLQHAVEGAADRLAVLPGVGTLFAALAPMVLNAVAGIITGAIVLGVVTAWQRLRGRGRAAA